MLLALKPGGDARIANLIECSRTRVPGTFENTLRPSQIFPFSFHYLNFLTMNTLPAPMMVEHLMPFLDFEPAGRVTSTCKKLKIVVMESRWSTRHHALRARITMSKGDYSNFEILPSSKHSADRSYCDVTCTDLKHYECKTLKFTLPLLYEPDLRKTCILMMYEFLNDTLPKFVVGDMKLPKRSMKFAIRELKEAEDQLTRAKAKVELKKYRVGQLMKRAGLEDDFAHVLPAELKRRRTTK